MMQMQRVRQWLLSRDGLLMTVFALGMTWLLYRSGLLGIWVESEEYGHGLMVVAVLAYLVYRRRDTYRAGPYMLHWLSLPLAVAALGLTVVGEASGISLLAYYGIWLFGIAAVFAVGGITLFRKLLAPLLIVLLLFPLPNPFGPMLTAKLQLISSELGVWIIRQFGGSVYLEGNVLDMGGSRLLVSEACAGLRYLFPLMSLGAIAGLTLRAPLWARWTVFLATIPITIFMNSFRIAVTGFLVESGGAAHTEGFLHFFEGWVVFVVAALLLLGVIWTLVKLQPGAGRLFDALSLDASEAPPSQPPPRHAAAGGTLLPAASALVLLAAFGSILLSGRERPPQPSRMLADFPMRIGEWSSRAERLPSIVEEVAGASEYFYGDYSAPSGKVINTYVSYYETQRRGQIPHSPQVCIPGGGWVIESLRPVLIKSRTGKAFEANRLVTSNGGQKVVSYYWLKQGPKIYRQELLARLDLVRSSLLENRTDGALIRLITELGHGETPESADARLSRFAAEFAELIPAYVPD